MVGGLEQHGVLRLLFRKLMAEAHGFVVALGAGEHGARQRGILAAQGTRGKMGAVRHFFAVIERLGEHDQVFFVAVVQALDNRDGVGQTAIIVGFTADVHRREVDRDGAGGAQHGAGAVKLHPVEVFRLASARVGHAHADAAGIAVVGVPVKRNQLVRDGGEDKLHPENRVVAPDIARTEIAFVIAVLPQHLQIAPALAGQVGYCIGDAGGNADDVIKHDVVVEQRVHHAARKYRTERTALQNKSWHASS